MSLIKELSQKAAQAAQILSVLDEIVKNAVLLDMAKSLRDNTTGSLRRTARTWLMLKIQACQMP